MDHTLHNGIKYVTRTQASELFEVPARTLRHWEKTRGLQAVKLPHHKDITFYEYSEVLKIIKGKPLDS